MGGERMRHSIRPWRWVVAPLTCAFVQALLAAPASAQAPTLQPNPQIQVEYIEPKAAAAADKAEYERTYAWLRERRPLEEIRKFLAPLRLPRPINMQVDTCGAEHRDYLSGGPVTVCYELIDKIQKVAAGIKGNDRLKQMVIVGTFTQAVLHELAYGVFDALQIPVWGRADDAADRLAAFVMLQFSGEIAHTAMVGSAEFFLLSGKTWTGSAFADAASPEGQRFYNFLCIAYGGDPLDFGGWTQAPKGQDPLLPKFRTDNDGCRYEYEQVRNAFNLRIMPYVDPNLLLEVKAAQWFLPEELNK
jgi:hypothetical protein